MLKLAVVGLGWWGRTIIDTLAASDAVKVTATADVNPQARSFAEQRGLRFLPDLDAVLAESGVEAVLLATPHTLHFEQIVRAAGARKHVFCEKPLCLSREDAVAAIAACNTAGVKLAVGHEKRFEPPNIVLRRMVEEGELGTLLQIEANFSQNKFLALAAGNWRLDAKEAPAGPLTATGIHLVDLSVSFLGKAESAFASVATLGSNLVNGDTLGALLRFRSGANALVSAMLATPFEGRFAVYGSNGWAEVRDKAHPEASQGWTLLHSTRDGVRSMREFPPAPAVRRNIEAFAAAIREEALYPMPQEEMIETVACLEAIIASARSGRLERVAG
ncbi:MAG TPA: Gfo/Idh/MocA family oxidoreductase [Hyphomicrobiaceae bacterium]|nr:Gfo/Idh/MocA family oxidoreductase [Hyphomicrobiaceae bacterium]